MKLYYVTGVLLVLSQRVFTQVVVGPVVNTKPGYCPLSVNSHQIFGLCPTYCRSDSGCPLNLKCCTSKCGGTACTKPDAASHQAKDGTCPGVLYSKCVLFNHASTCNSDQQCSGDYKCCSNGCGLSCRPPAANRAGNCPANTLATCSQTHHGSRVCTADSDCPNNYKCCGDGCVCSPPAM